MFTVEVPTDPLLPDPQPEHVPTTKLLMNAFVVVMEVPLALVNPSVVMKPFVEVTDVPLALVNESADANRLVDVALSAVRREMDVVANDDVAVNVFWPVNVWLLAR